MFPPEPPVAWLDELERRAGRKGAPVLRGGANPCARAPFWHPRSLRRAAEREHDGFPLVSSEHPSTRFTPPYLVCSRPADCSQRVVPRGIGSCEWRRTRPPFAVSGEFRRHRRLSLDLPASLETQTRRPQEVCLPLPSPQTARPGRSRCSASRLQLLSGPQAALSATLRCVSNGRASRSTAIR